MNGEEFNKMIDELLERATSKSYTKEEYMEQVEIRNALERDLQEMKNEFYEKHWQWARLNQSNSSEKEIQAAYKEVKDLKGRIYLRKEGLEKFYNQLVKMLE